MKNGKHSGKKEKRPGKRGGGKQGQTDRNRGPGGAPPESEIYKAARDFCSNGAARDGTKR